jgi:HEAT repeat protein
MTSILLPPQMPTTAAALDDAVHGSPDSRWIAACALGRESGELQAAAVHALEQLLKDRFEEIRAQALEGICEQVRSGFSVRDEIILEALGDSSPAVRCAAVDSALTVLGDPGPVLLPLSNDPDPSVRITLARAIGELPKEVGLTSLRALLDDRSELVRLEAAVALAGLGDSAGESILLDVLRDRGDDACEAARALGILGSERAMPILETLANRLFGPADLKALSKAALYRCSTGTKGKPLIEGALRARNADAKMVMLTALSRLPTSGLADEVGALLSDRDEMIV